MILLVRPKGKSEPEPLFIVVEEDILTIYLTDLQVIFSSPIKELSFEEGGKSVNINGINRSVKVMYGNPATLISCITDQITVNYACKLNGNDVWLELSSSKLIFSGAGTNREIELFDVENMHIIQPETIIIVTNEKIELQFAESWKVSHIYTLIDFVIKLSRHNTHIISTTVEDSIESGALRISENLLRTSVHSPQLRSSDLSRISLESICTVKGLDPPNPEAEVGSNTYAAAPGLSHCAEAIQIGLPRKPFDMSKQETPEGTIIEVVWFLSKPFTFRVNNGSNIQIKFSHNEWLIAQILHGLIMNEIQVSNVELFESQGNYQYFALRPLKYRLSGRKNEVMLIAQAISMINAYSDKARLRSLFLKRSEGEILVSPEASFAEAKRFLTEPVDLQDKHWHKLRLCFILDNFGLAFRIIYQDTTSCSPFIALQTISITRSRATFVLVPLGYEIIADTEWFETMCRALSLVLSRLYSSDEMSSS